MDCDVPLNVLPGNSDTLFPARTDMIVILIDTAHKLASEKTIKPANITLQVP